MGGGPVSRWDGGRGARFAADSAPDGVRHPARTLASRRASDAAVPPTPVEFNAWFLVAGALLTLMALAGTMLKRLPLSASLLYLLAGVVVGPLGISLLVFDPVEQAAALEHLTEIVVSLSLFAAGLKLRLPLGDRRWWLPVRLAFVSMTLTVGLVALVGVFGLGLSLGASVLLGAILAPTDPVLAADVQVDTPDDRDRLRFSLTGEAALNDGTAFPFVMLGLGLLGLHDLGAGGWRWWAVDVLWAVAGGLGIGTLLGAATGALVLYLRKKHREAVGTDDFLALGLVALAYGIAHEAHAYAFLAAFAAGLALRIVERRYSGTETVPEEVVDAAEGARGDEAAVDEQQAPAYMASAVLGFSEQLERIGTVALVVAIGAILPSVEIVWSVLWFVPVVLLVVRPVAVALGLLGARASRVQRGLVAWFGIRGIGSLYYLAYAITHGLDEATAWTLLVLTLATIATSVVVHGTSVTPLMAWYRRKTETAQPQA